jgi:hypothetical protein
MIPRKRFIHARFFSKERKGDIPWNIDVVLKVNGAIVDIQKVLIHFLSISSFSDIYTSLHVKSGPRPTVNLTSSHARLTCHQSFVQTITLLNFVTLVKLVSSFFTW